MIYALSNMVGVGRTLGVTFAEVSPPRGMQNRGFPVEWQEELSHEVFDSCWRWIGAGCRQPLGSCPDRLWQQHRAVRRALKPASPRAG